MLAGNSPGPSFGTDLHAGDGVGRQLGGARREPVGLQNQRDQIVVVDADSEPPLPFGMLVFT